LVAISVVSGVEDGVARIDVEDAGIGDDQIHRRGVVDSTHE
jgi:hypothetical protein